MRQKALEIRKAQTLERIEKKLDVLLKFTGFDPEKLEEVGRYPGNAKEPEANQEETLSAESSAGDQAEELVVKPEDQAIASSPTNEPPAEPEDKPEAKESKPRGRNK